MRYRNPFGNYCESGGILFAGCARYRKIAVSAAQYRGGALGESARNFLHDRSRILSKRRNHALGIFEILHLDGVPRTGVACTHTTANQFNSAHATLTASEAPV